MGGFIGLKNNSILVLKDEFYNDDVGVTFDKAPMGFCNA